MNEWWMNESLKSNWWLNLPVGQIEQKRDVNWDIFRCFRLISSHFSRDIWVLIQISEALLLAQVSLLEIACYCYSYRVFPFRGDGGNLDRGLLSPPPITKRHSPKLPPFHVVPPNSDISNVKWHWDTSWGNFYPVKNCCFETISYTFFTLSL